MSAVRLCTILAVAAIMAVVPTAAMAGPTVRASGPLTDLQLTTANVTDGAFARAQVTQHADHSTVTLLVTGLDSAVDGTTLGAHVHVGGCIAGNGAAAGPHFNIGGGVSHETEVWLDFTIHGGVGSAVAQVPFLIPDGGAGSIVIHALPTDGSGGAGARQACLALQL